MKLGVSEVAFFLKLQNAVFDLIREFNQGKEEIPASGKGEGESTPEV